ncbi:endonuclease/exonuclease/phosphatase family protein [Glutamicibacter sp.]|uniref:endonuclease/exonuclease/phosphatase family protein n=1 Tax=Glutamicibacter sp. TaxID=1931995 RepID=UPI0028BD1835|nr:endonuclease/exonuclease/phosphatase family protein [Glutamicibacter sp.]
MGARRLGGLRHPWLLLCAGLLALLSVLLPHMDALLGGRLPLVQALLPIICLALLLLGILALVLRGRAAGMILIAGALLTALPLLIPFAHTSTAHPGAQLRIFSLNVQHSEADIRQISDVIINNDVGVVVLAEANEQFITGVRNSAADQMLRYRTGKVTPGDASGTVILSRYPLTPQEPISGFGMDASFDQPVTVVNHPKLGALRLAGIHTQPPVVDRAISWKQSLEQLEAWSNDNRNLPLIIAGDFNASQGHPAYRSLAKQFTDSAVAAGIFPLPTWPSSLPFTAIDHILVTDFCPHSWERIDIAGSDHRGVLASVSQGQCVD